MIASCRFHFDFATWLREIAREIRMLDGESLFEV